MRSPMNRADLRSRSLSRAAALVAAVAVSAVLAGCYSSEIRNNPTPNLVTLSESEKMIENTFIITNDENLRMMRTDWERLWLSDRSSRLTRDPILR